MSKIVPDAGDFINALDKEICKGLIQLTPEQRLKPLQACASLTVHCAEQKQRLDEIAETLSSLPPRWQEVDFIKHIQSLAGEGASER